jgi:hypothetical protein
MGSKWYIQRKRLIAIHVEYFSDISKLGHLDGNEESERRQVAAKKSKQENLVHKYQRSGASAETNEIYFP